ncbi:MAG TPA: methyltransferase domain-containing protein [Candidatus Saccharimonadales bacterium]|nr:methyltransferase domain-containing protein [Candidatus Saccharimonadales bacterium]
MYIAILGRQPSLGMAELERLYGADAVAWFSDNTTTIKTDTFSIDLLGGTQKAGRIIFEVSGGDWRKVSLKLIQHYKKAWSTFEGKITLGISAYGFEVAAREVQKTGIILKQKLKETNISVRLIPNAEPILNTATSHHNKLGLASNKFELLVVKGADGRIYIAESIGAQNITSLARRDQGRPKRDAFVGMLPPKLAQIMINLATPPAAHPALTTIKEGISPRLLDPFCGTGVILQEAALMGYRVYGTDLNEKMIRYSRDNLNWLQDTFHLHFDWYLHQGDAMSTTWQQPIDIIVCESYLGQPFSAPPSRQKLTEVKENCNHIIRRFLQNLAPQLTTDTRICVAVPAWRDTSGRFTHLPLINHLEELGYTLVPFQHVTRDQLMYYREDQVVARELLVLVKA